MYQAEANLLFIVNFCYYYYNYYHYDLDYLNRLNLLQMYDNGMIGMVFSFSLDIFVPFRPKM